MLINDIYIYKIVIHIVNGKYNLWHKLNLLSNCKTNVFVWNLRKHATLCPAYTTGSHVIMMIIFQVNISTLLAASALVWHIAPTVMQNSAASHNEK